jgi:hypothetical protein
MGALVVVDFLALTGLGLLGVLGLGWWVLDDGVRGAVVSRVRAQRPLWIGWGLYVLAYGSLASAQHMMFGFRLLLPGLALAALLLADLAQHVPLVGPGRSRPRTAFWAALAVVMVLQLSGAVVLRFASVNPTRVGEYQHLAVTEYDTLFMDHLDEVARAIDEHWASTATAGERAPRVHTFAAGKLPYLLDEAYVFEELISYRHDCRDVDLNAAADYVHLMRSAADEALKPGAGEVIWSARSGFPGCVECGVEWVVLYNPSPSPNPLPPTTHGPCVFDQARR